VRDVPFVEAVNPTSGSQALTTLQHSSRYASAYSTAQALLDVSLTNATCSTMPPQGQPSIPHSLQNHSALVLDRPSYGSRGRPVRWSRVAWLPSSCPCCLSIVQNTRAEPHSTPSSLPTAVVDQTHHIVRLLKKKKLDDGVGWSCLVGLVARRGAVMVSRTERTGMSRVELVGVKKARRNKFQTKLFSV
jgi:hypothetical protein